MERQLNRMHSCDDGRLPTDNEKRKLPEQKDSLRPLAVVLDIDDTLVCNAPLEMYYVEHPEAKADYNAWEHWIVQHNELLPGARYFLKYTDKHGVQVFYVTGRGPQDKEVTIRFLQKAGLPLPDATHLLMNDRSGGKMNHFAKLARRYDIICYLGDNVADFPIGAARDENEIIYKREAGEIKSGTATTQSSDTAEKSKLIHEEKEPAASLKSEMHSGKPKTEMPLDVEAMLKHDKNAKRSRIIDAHKYSFGTKFILLPNPMYGDWENNLAKKYRKLPPEQRIALRKAALKCLPVTDGKKT
jgi:predicted secreted acid phosphatase